MNGIILGVTACTFALNTLLRMTTLTEREMGELQGQENEFFLQFSQGNAKSLGYVFWSQNILLKI